MNYVDLDNAREDDQKQVMQDIIDAEHCPFCPENLQKYHKHPVEIDGEFWTVTKNQWPYKNTKHHYLAILKRHAENLYELTEAEGAELIILLGKLQQKLDVTGGGLAFRFGDTNYSGGTVNHLHAQFIIPDIDKEDFEPTRFKIGKSRDKLKK